MTRYPEASEVAALLREAFPLNAVPGDAVRRWMVANGYDLDLHARWGSVVALPESAPVPFWACLHGKAWPDLGLRLLAPLCDAQGALRSLVAQSVAPGRTGAAHPTCHEHDGLIVACPTARRPLMNKQQTRRVVIVGTFREWLRHAESMRRRGEATSVWGVLPQAWSKGLTAALADADVTLIADPSAPHLGPVRDALDARSRRTHTNLTIQTGMEQQ